MIKARTFRPWLPGQTLLMPPSPIEWLPSDQLVFVLLDLPNEREVSALMAPALAIDSRGERRVDPVMVGQPSAQRLTCCRSGSWFWGAFRTREVRLAAQRARKTSIAALGQLLSGGG
jgi:hypothetical protein